MLSKIISYIVVSIIFGLLINTNVLLYVFSKTDMLSKDDYMKSLGLSILMSFGIIGLAFILSF